MTSQKLDTSKTEALFNEPPKNKSVKTGLYVPEELLDIVRDHSKATGRSVNEIIVKVLGEFFKPEAK